MNEQFDNDPELELKVSDNSSDGAFAAGTAADGGTPAGDGKPKKKRKGLKVALIVLAALLVLVVAAGAVAAAYANKYLNKINYTHDPIDPYDTAPIILDTLPPATPTQAPTATPPGMTVDPNYTATPEPTEIPEFTLGPDESYAPTEAIATIHSGIDENLDGVIMLDDSVYNVMLIGSDTRDLSTYRGNTDAMILLSLNHNTDTIWLTSFQRDTYLYIPGVGYNKLNFAYPRSGAKLLLRTIQENYKVGLSRYAVVTFDAFKAIVDALGGVTITVTDEETQYITGIDTGGTYKLNGQQTLDYARIRYIGTDFARTERQRTVMTSIINDLKGKSVNELLKVLDTLLPYITTNIPKSELVGQISQAGVYAKYEVKQLRIPIDGTWRYDILPKVTHVVIVTDFDRNVRAIRENVFAGVYDN